MSQPVIHVSAVVFRDEVGRVLTVRKQNTSKFMLPGGKPEEGEEALHTAIREVREEIGVELHDEDLTLLGEFTAPAANEPDHQLISTVYSTDKRISPQAAAEIAELSWRDPRELTDDLAPMLKQNVFPALEVQESAADSPASQISSITVFTGAAIGTNPDNLRLAQELGHGIARAGLTLVYGGGKAGLMGAVADACIEAGGKVIGVIPEHLVSDEIAHAGLRDLEVVSTMSERKRRMSELGDAFVALPGGTGTLDEWFEEWTSLQLGLHSKPVALYGTEFWQPMVAMIDHMVEQGFIRATDREHLIVVDSADELANTLKAWTPPTPKWKK